MPVNPHFEYNSGMILIDGHNLIPKVPGMTLRQMDDEPRLAELLQIYARLRRKDVEVYFDGAPPGHTGEHTYGMVLAHFVPKGHTADDAIRDRLMGMGKAARNVSVVSSDRMVQAETHRAGATVIRSEDFARELVRAWQEEAGQLGPVQPPKPPKSAAHTPPPKPKPAPKLPSNEVDEWLKLFGVDKDKDKDQNQF